MIVSQLFHIGQNKIVWHQVLTAKDVLQEIFTFLCNNFGKSNKAEYIDDYIVYVFDWTYNLLQTDN